MNIKTNSKILNEIIDGLAMALIGIFCFLYSRFCSEFAKINLKLNSLTFPLFVGELLLIACIFLLLLKFAVSPIKLNKWHWVLFGWILFIAAKALYGYHFYGALAFRNAALFYYSSFAIATYYFFNIPLLKRKLTHYLILSILLISLLLRLPIPYYIYSCIILSLVLILSLKNKLLRYSLIALFVLVLPYKSLFGVSRAGLLAHFAAWIFLFIVFLLMFNLKFKYKIYASLLFFLFSLAFIYLFVDPNNIKSLLNLKVVLDRYKEYKCQYVGIKQKYGYQESVIPVLLYEDALHKQLEAVHKKDIVLNEELKKFNAEINQKKETTVNEKNKTLSVSRYISAPGNRSNVLAAQELKSLDNDIKTTGLKDAEDFKKNKKYRSLNTAYSNIVWRMIVYSDMWEDIINEKRVFGADFGKPFRSKTIETLGWNNAGQWVGWIEPHNSYIHILYRAGVIGILFIFVLISLFIWLVKNFVKLHDIKGILLSSALVYWLIFPNFAVVLELPYFAIPFWCLFGITLRYAHHKIYSISSQI